MTTELRTDIFDHWLQIAGRASKDSESARRVALAGRSADQETFNVAVQREFEAALVGITASAFAIDAFFASVVEHAPAARVSTKARHSTITETLKRAFVLGHVQLTALHDPLRMLFRLRREAVHPPATWAAPVLHPVFDIGMEPRFVSYRAENAINAHLLAWKLVSVCVRAPRASHPALEKWCAPLIDAVGQPPPPRPEWQSGGETKIA